MDTCFRVVAGALWASIQFYGCWNEIDQRDLVMIQMPPWQMFLINVSVKGVTWGIFHLFDLCHTEPFASFQINFMSRSVFAPVCLFNSLCSDLSQNITWHKTTVLKWTRSNIDLVRKDESSEKKKAKHLGCPLLAGGSTAHKPPPNQVK